MAWPTSQIYTQVSLREKHLSRKPNIHHAQPSSSLSQFTFPRKQGLMATRSGCPYRS